MADWVDDDWGAGSAAAVPLPNHDMDFGFKAPAVSANLSATKNNSAVSIVEVPTNTPAATPDGDDWGDATLAPAATVIANDDFGFVGDDFGAAPAAGRDSSFGDDGFRDGASAGFGDNDPFGDAPAGGDAMDLTGTLLTGEDADNVRAGGPNEPPPAPKPKRVIRPDLIPDKTRDKGFHKYFITELSELYDDCGPKDTREVPLRRQQDYYVFAKELAASACEGAARPQADAEKKSKKKSHIHYNGDRKTTNYTWEDFEIRLLLCLIIRGVHISGTPATTDRWSKRRIMESRRSLNDSLPKATDGHTHRGQWAYHDVAKLLNFHTNDEIPVADVRDMIHRLVDQRKGALHLANRVQAPRMTKTVAMAWKRQQDFVGDLKEWYGEKGKEGRKDRLERLEKEKNELAHELAQNPMQQVEGDPGIDVANLGQAYTQKDAQRYAAGGGDPFDGFDDAPTPAQSAGGFDDWDSGNNFAAPPAAQPANNSLDDDAPERTLNNVAMGDADGDEWGGDGAALVATLANAIQAMDAPAVAPRRLASPLGTSGMENPFAAPVPGNSGFNDAAPAASANDGGVFGNVSASAEAAGGFDEWTGGDDVAAPPVAQPTNNNFGANASARASDDIAMDDASSDEWGDENAAPNAPARTKTPRGNADAFIDNMMANARIVSPPNVHQFGGFTAVNAPRHGFSSAHPPSASAPPAPAQSLNINSATDFSAERLARLSRGDTPPSQSPKKVFLNAGAFSPIPGGQVFRPASVGGIAGSNAIPLDFNRFTRRRAGPKLAPTSTPRADNGGSDDDRFGDNTFGNGSGRSGGGVSTPVQGFGDSPAGASGGAGDAGRWSDTPPPKPTQGGHVDIDAANGGAWGDCELDY